MIGGTGCSMLELQYAREMALEGLLNGNKSREI